jgi:uncharacterized protein YkwD
MKKKFYGFMALLLVLSTLFPISAGAASVGDFFDVKPGTWYYGAVDYAASHGLFSGTSAMTFSPDTPMTCGMFVTVLGRLAAVPGTYGRTASTPFTDVTQADYFFPYAVWANDNGLVTGVGGNAFNPNGEITREQMAAILFRYAEKSGYDITYSAEKYNAFTETASVSSYAVTALQWATARGIINGSDGKLTPQDKASRAQVAQIFLNFSRLEKAAPTEPSKPEEPNDPKTDDPADWENYNPTYDIPTGKSAVDADGGYYDYDLANEIMAQIDALRIEKGGKALLYNPKIQAWAGVRAQEQTVSRSHTRPNGTNCLTVGVGLDSENLAWITKYTVEEMSAREYAANVVAWWNGSESHRLGMLKTANNLGAVSCYVKGDNVYIAHLFSMKSLYYMDYLI